MLNKEIILMTSLLSFLREKKVVCEKADPRLQPSDTHLLPKDPGRGSRTPATSSKTNSHVVVEFGLQVSLGLQVWWSLSNIIVNNTILIFICLHWHEKYTFLMLVQSKSTFKLDILYMNLKTGCVNSMIVLCHENVSLLLEFS